MSRYNNRFQSSPNYGGSRRGTAKKGIISMVITVFSLIILGLIVGIAASKGGKAAPIIGMASIVDIAIAFGGIWVGIQSFHEVDKSYTVSRISIILGGITILSFLFLYYIGIK